MALEEPADNARQRPVADGLRKALRDLCQCQVRLLRDPAEDQVAMPVNAVRAMVPAPPVRLQMPPRAGPGDLTDR